MYCDRVENNENKITILAKELRSLRRNVKSKISNLQEDIGTQNNYKQHYRYYEMKKLFKKVHDLKYLTLTLKLDVRQLFYEGLSLETKMKYFVTGKTKTLSNEISELRESLRNIYNRTNISESWDLQSDVLPTNRTVIKASENTTGKYKTMQIMNASAVSLLFVCLCYRACTDFVPWIDTSYPLFFSHIPFPFIKRKRIYINGKFGTSVMSIYTENLLQNMFDRLTTFCMCLSQ